MIKLWSDTATWIGIHIIDDVVANVSIECLPLPASLEKSRQFAINFEVCCSHNDNILLFCNNCNDMFFVFLLLFFFTPNTILVVNSSQVILMAERTDTLH